MRLAAWVWPVGLLPVGCLVVALAWVSSNLGGRESTVIGGPAVQITAPASGFKLRQGRTMAVRISVRAGQQPLQGWTLQLVGPLSGAEDLAEGTEAIADGAVAQVAAENLTPGETYRLVLQAVDSTGVAATDRVSFLIPDPQYTLIPLEPGNMSKLTSSGLSIDGPGTLVAMGGARVEEVRLLDVTANVLRTIHLNLQGSGDFRLSGDGQRLVFGGTFPEAGFLRAFGILDLATDAITLGPASGATNFFTTDRTGRWLAFQSNADLDPSVGNLPGTLQYFLYDDVTNEVRQLTKDPNAIIYSLGANFCPAMIGTTPLISSDGSTVVFATSATLGLVPPDAAERCHVFAYDIASRTMRHVGALAPGAVLDTPVVSGNAQLLSFTDTRSVPPDIRRDFGALMDLTSGEITEPVGGISEFPSFDSVATGDDSAVILSTEADVDPRVGNADHNMEIVSYDLATGRFTQISETTEGIGHLPGGCESYTPLVSADGHVVAFSFMLISVGGCHLDEPQRNEADGFVFQRVRAVRKRPGNHAPVLQPVADTYVTTGGTLSLDFAATDPDGDPVVFFAQVVGSTDIPAGSSIEDHRNGSATFTWPTKPEQIGAYQMRVAAFDEGGGETVQDFTIAVCSSTLSDGTLPGVLAALFEPGPPAQCRGADMNRDRVLSAADVVKAAAGG